MASHSDYRLVARRAGFAQQMKITVSGAGEAAVLLGNGFGTDQRVWAKLLPWLEPRFRVVRFDWMIDPVHFDAACYASLDRFAEDMLAVVVSAGCAPCTLVGHSMSAMIGMLAAKRDPAAFRRIVMIAAAPCYVIDDDYPVGLAADDIDALLDRIGDDYLAWCDDFSPVAVGRGAEPALVDDFRQSLRAMRPDVALSMARTVFLTDMRDRLSGYATPTVLIQPSDDPIVPVAAGEYLARCWPHARLELIEASGHLPHLTAPDTLRAALARALG